MDIKKICLFSQGSRTWIAGHIYIGHIVEALFLHYPNIELHIIHSPRSPSLQSIQQFPGSIQYHRYAWHKGMTPFKKTASIIYSLLKGRELISLDQVLNEIQPDFLYPSPSGINYPNSAHWIPDFQHRIMPQFFPGKAWSQREKSIKKLIKSASHIVLSSQDSKMDLLKYYTTDHLRISVLPFRSYFGSEYFIADPLQVVEKYRLPKKFFMFPANLWKHKNHMTLLRAILSLSSKYKNICLVLTGSWKDQRSPKYYKEIFQFIHDNGLKKNVLLLGLIPRYDQVQLMRQSIGIIQPSYFEGWSALVEDARALGKEIIVSDIPIHREQAPHRATFFRPEDIETLIMYLTDVWNKKEPGPNIKNENIAQRDSEDFFFEFARKFMEIAKSTS